MTRLRQFLLFVAEQPHDDQIEALFVRGDDASFEFDPAAAEAWVAFDREAPTLVDAMVSAVRDVDAAGLVTTRVDDDDDVVTLGLIGQRTGRSEDAVRRWARGDIGPGGFPAPLVEHPRRPCYLWTEVTPWLSAHYRYEPPDTSNALRAVNLALELRALGPTVERMTAVRGLLSS